MTTITSLPPAPNPITDSQSEFNSKALAFTEALPTLITEINTVSGEINTAKTNAETAASSAASSASSASASAAQAQANANVSKWLSGTTYAQGDCVWSPQNFQTYRRKVAGGGTTDPSEDSTNWQIITSNGRPGWVKKISNYTAQNGDAIMADTSGGAWTLTLPASPAVNHAIYVCDYAGTFSINNLTISRNGEKIMGLSEDLTISTDYVSIVLTYFDSTKGWIIT